MNEYPKVSEGILGEEDTAKTNTEKFLELVGQYFPEAIKDGEVDFTALKEEMGEFAEVGSEHYDFTWAGKQAAKALVLNFSDTSVLTWPVRGNVILDYSMDQTIYFPTLEQYRCSPGIVIQGSIGEPVYAPANARVLETGTNEEIGTYVTLDFGNGYEAVCGQLSEVSAVPGEYLEQGQVLGYVAEPTKYYTIEGSNVFFELTQDGKAIDPMGYLE